MDKKLLEIRDLKKHFKTPRGTVHAVDGVSFTIERGRTLGVVGESGCGKSTLGRCILRLIEPTEGEVIFEGKNICTSTRKEMKELRKEMQIIFQDPYSSINPRKTVLELIAEPIKFNKLIPNATEIDIENRVLELMQIVGIDERLINAFPHELDGGRRQRIGIARALSLSPKFIVCDEPVSALDVSIQAQILNLLRKLQREQGLTYLFITHDLSVINYFADDILVMYLGQVVEKAPSELLFENPTHPYTQALLSAILVPKVGGNPDHIKLRGEVASPIDPPNECRFAKRCNYVQDECRQSSPPLIEISPGHFVACHFVGKGVNNLKETVVQQPDPIPCACPIE